MNNDISNYMNNSGNMYMYPNMNNFGNINTNMIDNPNMNSSFLITFRLNGNFSFNMPVNKDMEFCEVIENFFKCHPMLIRNGTSFIYNSCKLEQYSTIKLNELGIKQNSKIDVITPKMNEKIQIVFNYKNVLQANKDTVFSDLSKRFCSQAGILNKVPIYYLGSKKIDPNDNQTLSQLNIYNNSEISVLLPSEEEEEYFNVKFNSGFKTINVQATKNTQFSDLCKRYCNRAEIRNKDPIYLFNSCVIKSNETRTLAQLNINDESKIDVLLYLDNL